MSDVTVGDELFTKLVSQMEIINSLSNVYMAFPSDEQVDEISSTFWRNCVFQIVLGASTGNTF